MATDETFLCKTMEATKITSRFVDVINKRVIAKMIISLCGNEAAVDDAYDAVLRRLLQHAISVIEVETQSTLENAEFKFYDDKCDIYTVLSGKGENKFEFTYNEKLEPEVIIHRKTTLWTIIDTVKRRTVGCLVVIQKLIWQNDPTRPIILENPLYPKWLMLEYPHGPSFPENPSTRRESEEGRLRTGTKPWHSLN